MVKLEYGGGRPMKFRKDAPRVLIVAVIVVIAAVTVASNLLFSGMTRSVEQSQLDLMKAIVNFNLDGAASNALARAEILAANPSLRAALARGDRAEILAETEAMFAEQKEKYGVDQVQFHLAGPPATSFLRLQAPTVFGDDLSRFRPIVVAVNREHVAKKGIAIAKSGPAIFGVAPMRGPDGEHIGSVEFGVDFGSVLDRLKAAYGLDLTLFMDEIPLREFATGIQPGILTEQNRVGSTIKFHSTNWALMRELVKPEDIRIHDEERTYTRQALGKTYGVVLVPIRSGSGAVLGVIAVSKSFEATRSAAGRSLVIQILLAVVAIVVLIGAILVVIRGYLLRPLSALTERFAALGTGKTVEDDEDDARLCDEMAALAAEHQRLTAREARARPPAKPAAKPRGGK